MASTAFKNLAKKVSLQELKWLRDSAPNQQALHNMLSRRVAGEPLQYILGIASSTVHSGSPAFFDSTFQVTHHLDL